MTTAELSYRDTDGGGGAGGRFFHPLIQQKRLVTGQNKDDQPQTILQYRGLPFAFKPRGIMNVTGLNEGVVQARRRRCWPHPPAGCPVLAMPPLSCCERCAVPSSPPTTMCAGLQLQDEQHANQLRVLALPPRADRVHRWVGGQQLAGGQSHN